MINKLRSGFFFIIGYLLSPLCWWNDLIFNLPIAYFFGKFCSLFYSDLLIPGSILGYWLSNLVGILMMQMGAVEFFHDQSQERNQQKYLLTGLASSTIYTIVILGLLKLHIFDTYALVSLIQK